ncbi:MAG: TIGR01777 family oxidoreductase [Opitutaceae bacterium]|nr:TIGR01777 family oxidoreductase [Opitutaceae bacterium]
MKLVVAGASGFIGSALVRRLEGEGHRVLRLVRRPVEGPDEVEWHPAAGEVEQRDLLEGIEAVVNFAGSNLAAGRWTEERREEIFRSRIESARTLVTVMAHMNHKPRVFVSASAVGYYGNRGEEVLTEGSGPGEGFLAGVCHAWEAEARVAETAGIRTVRLRIGLVLGNGGALAKLRPVFRAGCGGILGDGRQWMSWITIDDLVRTVLHGLRDDRLAGPVNAVAPGAVRNAEFAKAFAHALGRHWTFPPVPAFVLRTIFREMADEMFLASTRVQPQRLLEAGFNFEQPGIGAALHAVLSRDHALLATS